MTIPASTSAPRPAVGDRARFFAGVFGVFTAIVVASALQHALVDTVLGREIPFGRSFAATALTWYLWALLTPAIASVVWRFPFTRDRWRSSLLVHVPASAALFGVQMALFGLASRSFGLSPELLRPRLRALPLPPRSAVQDVLVGYAFRGAGTYALIVLGLILFDYVRKDRERVALEGQLALAELKALRMQLQPHFLFNTLHAIGVLIHSDPKAAHLMLTRLAELLRLSLDTASEPELPLETELLFVEKYLAIQKVRFGDRLTVRYALEPGAMRGLVPTLVMQPLVENALEHGLAPHARLGVIEIAAAREGDVLTIRVRDNGDGLKESSPRMKSGVGLANTRGRLRQLYGDRSRLTLSNVAGGGLEAFLEMPWREAPLPSATGGA
ncbi:MAG TPA: sensor histidine kinase [Thermoanaerobaculia bacterium]